MYKLDMMPHVLSGKNSRKDKKVLMAELEKLNPNDLYKKQRAADSIGGAVRHGYIRLVGNDYVCQRWKLMKIYDLLREISQILAKENSAALYRHLLHTLEYNGGFLRSRHCYLEEVTLSDFTCKEFNVILVALREPFDFNSSNPDFESLKLQIVLQNLEDEKIFRRIAIWNRMTGFMYFVKINIEKKNAEILYKSEKNVLY